MPVRLQLPQAREPRRRSYLYREVSMFGARHLKDVDILASAFSGDLKRRQAVAERILFEVGSLWAVSRLSLRGLRELGLGQGEAARLKACVELGRRAMAEPLPRSGVNEPRDAYRCVARALIGAERERFVVVVLDVKNRPRHVSVVFEGSVDACPVDPREVFGPALRERGTAVLIAHNHPSGDPTPSKEDLILTDRLIEAGRLLSMPVLDHIIVGRDKEGSAIWVSLAERGLMPLSAAA